MSAPTPELRSSLIARSPVYYGWVVLAIGTLGMMMTVPGQTVGVAIFLDGIIFDLGLSRSGVSTLYLIGTLLGSLTLPFVGRFVDRRGPRVAVAIVATAFALACVWMGFVQSAWMLLVGFTLIRALGQGALSLLSVHSVAIWFVRRRGIAIGILGIGMAIWMAFFPTLVERLIEPFGWRTTYMLLGALVAFTILPLGALLLRDRPERYGIVVDGGPAPGVEGTTVPEAAYRPSEARATRTYWLFLAGLWLGSNLGTGLAFHHYGILAAGGLDRATAAAAFVPLGIMSAVGNLGTGALFGRVPPRVLLTVNLLLLGAALVLAGRIAGPGSVWLYGGLLGMRGGMASALEGNAFVHYFGRAHIGAIRGQVVTAMVIGSAVGPLLFALGPDVFGSYTPVLVVSSLPVFALAVAALFLRPYRDGRVR